MLMCSSVRASLRCWLVSAGVAVMLAGCSAAPVSDLAGNGSEASSVTTKRKPPLAKMSFAGGAVVVAGPEGYCLDPETSASSAGRGIAVIASCLILSDGKVGIYVAPVIVTVTIGPRATVQDLPDAAALAEAAGTDLLAGGMRDGLVVAHLASGGDAMLDEGDTRYWRGAFIEGERAVGLALYAPKGDALAGERGVVMLEKVRASIRRAGSGKPVAVVDAKTTTTLEKPRQNKMFSRLFGS